MVTEMKSVFDHPWLSNPYPFADVDSIRVCMKNAAAMLQYDSPPDWIIILDRTGRFSHSRMRVVIAEQATIDFEPTVGDSPSTTILTDDHLGAIADILAQIDRRSNLDVERPVIDGSPCALSVINGKHKWVSFGEFNINSMDSDDLLKPGPALAMLLTTISDSIAT